MDWRRAVEVLGVGAVALLMVVALRLFAVPVILHFMFLLRRRDRCDDDS